MKRRLRKIICVAAAAALIFSMTACGGGSSIKSDLSMAPSVEKYLEKVDHEYSYNIAKTLAYDETYLSNDLGWRTAGSDAEHKAADYLAGEMEGLGLEDVEKVPVTVDKWQFNDASLTVEGTKIDIMPASYATNGTDKNGITAEIVDVGNGFAADYEGKDLKGKIALAGVDQWNVAWIDQYMNEAALHGAAAIVTYDTGGYATYSDDMINMQDVCSKDVIPCVSISKNQYKELAEAIKSGNSQATLKVDNIMEPDKGTSYNVIGKIKGKSSDQQIIVSGHYDVYFNGFQDDSCAIGLVLGMAKAMKDSEYTPENDIVFVAHGSEEWGATGSQFDWTTGAWEMINHAHPEWAGKTIAMINFELPAFYDGMEESQISCVPEFASIVKNFVESSGLAASPANDIYPKGISSTSVDTNCLEDGVSYRASGVPYFINIPGTQDGDKGWMQQRYHTVADDKDTYSEDVMTTNLNTYGSLAIYLDQTPALPLDLTATCDDLDEALNEDMAKAAGADSTAYKTAVSNLRNAAEGWNKKIADINDRYEKAVSDGEPEETLQAIREEGKALNKKTLEAFKYVQDHFIGIILTSDVVVKHLAYQSNIELISGVTAALEKGDLSNEDEKSGALDIAWNINGGAEFGYYNFSPETCKASENTLLEKTNKGNIFWGTGKGSELADTKDATLSILEKAATVEKGGKATYEKELSIYGKALKQQQNGLKNTMAAETKAMGELNEMLK
ncbi:M28 family metallopeptidase [Anaerovorax odorimutans]|uniref:M28 family metallopeptidase n=1 Tax=Anaerovorax odorimutans TaxID=109327 RepID=A0ABT1RQN5_9FIRM|nr:M28 family peptidase [Anaerovorax odorimutans]MCQ4637478.1 M28 family metallopeptidase [Anaerovorax odorimutans]